MLDLFLGNGFTITSLTDTINTPPFVPGRAGLLLPWDEKGITTKTLAVEEIGGALNIINPSPRGGPGDSIAKQKRTLRYLAIPHYQRDDAIYADEVQDVRAFGSENQMQTVEGMVSDRMAEHVTQGFDPTIEYQRVGAVKGIILNGDGSTLFNLFDEFGVAQEAEIDFDLDAASPVTGALRKKCAAAVRLLMDNLGAANVVGIHAFSGNNFFDDLLGHREVEQSYAGTPMASVLRDGYVYPNNLKVYGAFEFGGIVWENYRGSINGSAIIETDKCHIFPIGEGLWATRNAPADYRETVNTVGRPRYAKQFPMADDKGVHLQMQANSLSFCKRPKALLKGKRT